MSSKFVDMTSIMQVIGCVYNQPQLLDYTDKYSVDEEDFPDQFHKVILGQFINYTNQELKQFHWKILLTFWKQDRSTRQYMTKREKSGY